MKKTVVRMPGPSCIENRWMSKMRPRDILEVLRSRNDFFLHVGREIHEELAEAGSPHDKVAILFRILFRNHGEGRDSRIGLLIRLPL